MNMSVTLETIQQELREVRKELVFLRHMIEEDYELSEKAKKQLKKARHEMARGKYIKHEDMLARYG